MKKDNRVNQSQHYLLWVESWPYPGWCALNWVSWVLMYSHALKPCAFFPVLGPGFCVFPELAIIVPFGSGLR